MYCKDYASVRAEPSIDNLLSPLSTDNAVSPNTSRRHLWSGLTSALTPCVKRKGRSTWNFEDLVVFF